MGIDWKAEQEKEKHCGREDGELKRKKEGDVDEHDLVHDACRPGEDQHTPLRPDNEKDYGGEDEIYPYLVIAIATMPRQYTSWPPM